ncbi:nucleotide-binding universal stress UspA family protein [Rhodoferax ferrireducens]|uniref:Universal stress protein n=1 Tax=Rhodoferax ferrireducens TaxID=192843 RepID=A0ABU2C1Y0_9BURK|nr:universal stress protein [Rhodoferax ferrireducens]MDR7375346.1 nucleotide-binding universal stress UspA family protein [Rhodoferax ferrireducens]
MLKHILLATDGSTASDHAAALAVDLARSMGAKLTSLYAVDPYPYLAVGEMSTEGVQYYMAAAQQEASAAHAKVQALCNQGSTVALQTIVVEDRAVSKAIVENAHSEGADMIVIGSHGRTGIAKLMLGSITTKVLAESTLPVLVAR